VKSSSLPPECTTLRGLGVSDGHSTDTSSASERLFGAPSEGKITDPYIEPNTVFVLGTWKERIAQMNAALLLMKIINFM
jgi:hypothetical protein